MNYQNCQKILIIILLFTFIHVIYQSCKNKQSNDEQTKSNNITVNTTTQDSIEFKVGKEITEFGKFEVPGEAYISGISLDGDLTILNVAVWKSFEMSKLVCRIKHNSKVNVLKYIRDKGGQIMFLITDGYCQGWVPEVNLCDKMRKPSRMTQDSLLFR